MCTQPEDSLATPRLDRLAGPARALAWSALGATAALLLLPKLLLVEYCNDRLWTGYGVADLPALLMQDVLLALLAVTLGAVLLRRPTTLRLAAGLGGVILAATWLMLDCRVRQLYHRPLDAGLVSYTVQNFHDLESGEELFFRHKAGFGATFRRLFALVMVAIAVGAFTAGVALARAGGLGKVHWRLPLALALGLALVASRAPRHTYRLEENVLVAPLVALLRKDAEDLSRVQELAARCDQPEEPLAGVLARSERRLLAGERPFENVIVFVLESVRWKDLALDGNGPTPTPALRRLAHAGVCARTRVSIPHSSKAHYALLTGRHPSPGIEMLEAHGERSSLFRALARRDAATWVFSTAFLGFENLGGMYDALGVDRRIEIIAQGGTASSFGGSDEELLGRPVELLAGSPRPFAAMFVTVAPHYPYDYPGKPAGAPADRESYLRSLAYADSVLARLLDRLDARGLLEDTLVVAVADHGESFGEHGTFVHNNGLFEEEALVPLVLWAKGGRLRQERVLEARQIDVAPTVADLLGLDDPEWTVQGQSILRQPGPGPAYLASFFDRVAMGLVEGDTKWLFEPQSGRVRRYDLTADPEELAPLTPDPAEAARVIERLEAFAAHQRLSFAREPALARRAPPDPP